MKKRIIYILTIAISMTYMSACKKHDLDEPGKLVPLTVDEDPGLPSISVNGTLLHSETFGNPSHDIILAIHGGPGSDYRSILKIKELMDEDYYVVFYDQRGSGLSRRHDKGIYTTQLFLDDLHEVIKYYRQDENQNVILFGHSWGAMLAAGYVNQHPNEVDGLILAEPGGFTWDQTKDYISRSRQIKLFEEASNDYVYIDQIITAENHNELDYKMIIKNTTDIHEGNSVGNPGPYPFWRYGAVCSSASSNYVIDNPFDFTVNLSSYSTNVLFAYSELNEAYGYEHAESVASPFSNVTFTEVIGAGHECIYFGWESLYPAVKDYLNNLSNNIK